VTDPDDDNSPVVVVQLGHTRRN